MMCSLGKEEESRKILYEIVLRILRLMLEFLVDNTKGLDQFRQWDGLNKLYVNPFFNVLLNGLKRRYLFLEDPVLRGPALRLIAIDAIGSKRTLHRVSSYS